MTTTPLPQDEVIRMARKAGLYVGTNISGVRLVGSAKNDNGLLIHMTVDELANFATQARADLEAENNRLREALNGANEIVRQTLSAAPVAQQPRQCGLCGSDEAFTGTCGGGKNNPHALCYEPVAQQPQEPDWKHPKIQALIGADARNRIVIDLIWRILENPQGEFSASDMEYWDSIHDAVQTAMTKAQQPQAEAVPAGYRLVMVPDASPGDEPDWDECIRKSEVATGLKVERHTISIVIREVRRWLAHRQADKTASQQAEAVPSDWTPTSTNINALPAPVRAYIHDLVANADPAGTVRDLSIAKQTIRELEASNRMLRDKQAEAVPIEVTEEMVLAGGRALCKLFAEAGEVNFDDQWRAYAKDFKDEARAVLAAAIAQQKGSV